jgi:hypothetical protein
MLVVGSHPCRVVVRILLGAAAAGLRCVVADMGRRGAVGACDINVCATLDDEIGGEDSSQVSEPIQKVSRDNLKMSYRWSRTTPRRLHEGELAF